MPFTEILGQEKAISYLKTLVQTGRMPGALTGPTAWVKQKQPWRWPKPWYARTLFPAKPQRLAVNALPAKPSTAKPIRTLYLRISYTKRAWKLKKTFPAKDMKKNWKKN